MNVAFTLAVGDKSWGEKSLNWGLSVKNANPKAKTALIHTASAIAGIEEYVNMYFDYTLQMPDEENSIEQAFRVKTELYDIITKLVPDADAYLFMDADTIMLSGRSVDEFFVELKGVDFTMWCNDVYDFETKTRMRDDYTFWCEPEEMRTYFEGGLIDCKMPQVNSSFIYFKKSHNIKHIFYLAQSAWHNQQLPHKKYKGVMPDEFCFNLSLTQNKVIPHQIPYYPIFFSFASEHFEEQYIRNWKAIGFAGDTKQMECVVHLYNHNVKYFRAQFDVPEYIVSDALPEEETAQLIHIKPISRRTLFRRGEVDNSDGGIFNPDGVYKKEYGYVTIFRKEKNGDFYKVGHSQATALPHLHILTKLKEENFELGYFGKDYKYRFEDFRIVENSFDGKSFLCSHTVIKGNLTAKMEAVMGISQVFVDDRRFVPQEIVRLPVEGRKIEKNWVFFIEDDILFCLYSIQPYMLFEDDGGKWVKVETKEKELDWISEGLICISTRPVLIKDEYLVLFHTKVGKKYSHGALIINKETKQITHYTNRPIFFPFTGEGWQEGLLYISGGVYVEERNLLQIFGGEGDTHSIRFDFSADDFMIMIKQNTPNESFGI